MTSTVTAAAVSKNFGAYQDAAVREPVIITKNGRPRIVLLAYEDYLRLSRRDRRVAARPSRRGDGGPARRRSRRRRKVRNGAGP